jgi:hypothetical protein
MNDLPPIHIALIQPAGHVHALALLDPARYARFQLRRFGGEVTLAKNRLREDAVNLVFGAHHGFASEWAERHACVFFNLEQLGEGGATLDPAYLELLKRSAVVDYDAANRAAYAADPDDVPLLPIQHALYLESTETLPLEERPIDLLFVGSMNERRKRFIDRIEACGLSVATFDHPVYGDERDAFIRQAKAVVNCHYYPSSRFEQVRVAHCLSLGTPVISERSVASAAFDDAVFWLEDDASFERFWRDTFGTAAFFDDARARLAVWRTHDPVDAYADLMAFAAGVFQVHQQRRRAEPWRPSFVNLGSGKDYKPGWLNLDVIERAEPDLVLDLAKPIDWPLESRTRFGGSVRLEANSVQAIYANNVLEHVADLPTLMGNALALLEDGGLFEIEVPYEKAPTAWQDPTHVRAFNPKSWLYYTDWFWYLGWFTHRFEIAASGWMDGALRACDEAGAQFMRVTLRKVATTPHERTMARAWRADFGGLPEDRLPAHASAHTTASEGDDLSHRLCTALPAAQRLHVVGDDHALRAWFDRHPHAQRVDDGFDAVAVTAPLEQLADAGALLRDLSRRAAPGATLVVHFANGAGWRSIECAIGGDGHVDAAALAPAAACKLLLDAGWMPQLVDAQTAQPPEAALRDAALRLADAAHVPRSTALRQLGRAHLIVQARAVFDAAPGIAPPLKLAVIVPTTRALQFELNTQRSPGLAEVQARILSIRDAADPADAVAQALPHCGDADWVLLAHQDVYFPAGFGHRLASLLDGIAPGDRDRTLIGFAGIGCDASTGRVAPAGFVIDRLQRFDHPASPQALSIDELALVFSARTVHRIDPALGWHLWATDLCLAAIERHGACARIERLPVFHNSLNDFSLPEAFHASARVLAAKYPRLCPIPTLCGEIGERVTPAPPSFEGRIEAGHRLRLPTIEAAIEHMVNEGDAESALALTMRAVHQTYRQPEFSHRALYYPGLDTQLEHLAVRFAGAFDRCADRPASGDLIIATELYALGGHSRVLEDVARELAHPLIVLTDLFGTLAHDPAQLEAIRRRYAPAPVQVLTESTLAAKAHALASLAATRHPARILHFGHHQDPLPYVATLGHRASRQVFFHHADHNPSLGPTLPGLHHVDCTASMAQRCADGLDRPATWLPLYVPDLGGKSMPPITGRAFSVATSGHPAKFARDGEVSLARIAAAALGAIDGRFFHIGPLPDDWRDEIRAHLAAQGLAPERFVTLGLVASVWCSLKAIDAAVVIGSAPVSGGRAGVEAQGCGCPVLCFTGFAEGSLLADFSSYADLSLGWRNVEQLAERLAAIAPHHVDASRRARRFYEQHFSRQRFAQVLREVLDLSEEKHACSGAVPAIA